MVTGLGSLPRRSAEKGESNTQGRLKGFEEMSKIKN